MTAVAAAFGADQIGDAVALTDGFSAGLLGAAGIAAVGAVLAWVWLRTPQSAPVDVPADGVSTAETADTARAEKPEHATP